MAELCRSLLGANQLGSDTFNNLIMRLFYLLQAQIQRGVLAHNARRWIRSLRLPNQGVHCYCNRQLPITQQPDIL